MSSLVGHHVRLRLLPGFALVPLGLPGRGLHLPGVGLQTRVRSRWRRRTLRKETRALRSWRAGLPVVAPRCRPAACCLRTPRPPHPFSWPCSCLAASTSVCSFSSRYGYLRQAGIKMEQGESLASNTSLTLKRSVFFKSFWLQPMYGHLTGLPASLAWWGGVRPGHWTCGYLLSSIMP